MKLTSYLIMIYCHMYIADSDVIVCSAFLALRSTPNARNWCQG